MFDILKFDLEMKQEVIGGSNSKTSTSSAFSDKEDCENNIIQDGEDCIIKDFINKKRKRRINIKRK